ncbi:MAG: SynChlorMet cassette protein ScmC [Methanomicrobiales archaeon]|nr:SynChlorMet cassette protein ScmC [Methanomicrobiales archaeon]
MNEKRTHTLPCGDVPRTGHSGSYALHLADGTVWSLVATKSLEPWVEKLARTMGLSPVSSVASPCIIFRRRLPLNYADSLFEPPPDILESYRLPEHDWIVRREKGYRNWYHREDAIVEIESGGDEILAQIPMGDALTPLYRNVIARGGLPLHAALIEYRGCGCLLVGSGGSGKSTCAHRIPPPWHPICDDATLVVRAGKEFHAHPLPTWSELVDGCSERRWHVEEHIPCVAVFILEKAPTTATSLLGQARGAISLYHAAAQVYGTFVGQQYSEWDREVQSWIFRNAGLMAKAVPCYLLQVSLEGQFWNEMERML